MTLHSQLGEWNIEWSGLILLVKKLQSPLQTKTHWSWNTHSITALKCHKNIRLKICTCSTQGHTIIINTVQTANMKSLKKTLPLARSSNTIPLEEHCSTCWVAEMAFPHSLFQGSGKIFLPSHLSKAPGGKISFYSSFAFPKTLQNNICNID